MRNACLLFVIRSVHLPERLALSLQVTGSNPAGVKILSVYKFPDMTKLCNSHHLHRRLCEIEKSLPLYFSTVHKIISLERA